MTPTKEQLDEAAKYCPATRKCEGCPFYGPTELEGRCPEHFANAYLAKCAEVEELKTFAEEVVQWSEAYPTNIFHEPTPEEARKVFEKAGFTMDCFSAMVLRAFTKPWGNKARKALEGKE